MKQHDFVFQTVFWACSRKAVMLMLLHTGNAYNCSCHYRRSPSATADRCPTAVVLFQLHMFSRAGCSGLTSALLQDSPIGLIGRQEHVSRQLCWLPTQAFKLPVHMLFHYCHVRRRLHGLKPGPNETQGALSQKFS